MDLVQGLNNQQKEAVLYIDGPLLVLAGAGSGKTKVLTHKIAYLVKEKNVDYNDILAITFTNKAAKEMKERVCNLLGKKGSEIWVSTFHSMCARILRKSINKIGYTNQFTIYDSDDQKKLIKGIISDLGYDDKIYTVKKLQYIISDQKNNFVSANEYQKESLGDFTKERYADIYINYQKKLKESNCLDFDDLIYKTVELLISDKETLEYYSNRFKYIMVDEYQDTNNAQYKLVQLLASKHRNLCVVGDDDQSIYKWRGANIRNILDFEKDFKEAKSIKLEQNYRCTKNILSVANEVVKNNIGRKDKTLWTDNEEGDKINFFKAFDERDEALYITDVVQKNVENKINKYSDFAVLYRTNAQSRAIEEKLVRANIPYQLFGGVKFYERKEIKDILAYLKVLINPADEISLKRIINVPKRNIGKTSLDKAVVYGKNNGITLFNAILDSRESKELEKVATKFKGFIDIIISLKELIDDMRIDKFIELVMDKTGYLNMLKLENTEEAKNRIENLYQFVAKAAEYEENLQIGQIGSLTEFLEEVSLVAEIDKLEDVDDSVKLMTLHTAKGLEFPIVFISGFEDGIFPSYISTSSEDEDEVEEERRLCYVGITRAEKKLYITHAESRRQYGRTVYNRVSRFFNEIPQDYLNISERERKKMEILENDALMNKLNNRYKNNYVKKQPNVNLPSPKNVEIDYEVGDMVRHIKFGEGTVKSILPSGADFEVTVEFKEKGIKKLLSRFVKLKKIKA